MQSSRDGLASWSRTQASETGWGWGFLKGILCPELGQLEKGILVCVVALPERLLMMASSSKCDGEPENTRHPG